MKLEKDFTYYLSADTIEAIAQNIYDNANFRGLSPDEAIMMKACKDTYKNLRGTDIPLTYNCPS